MRRDAKQKVLLLLLGGVAPGLSKSPKGYFKILKSMSENWRQIKTERLYRIVHEFYNDRLIDYKEDKDGFVKIVLTKEGEKKALKFKIDEMEIKKPVKWDGEWRIVIFDIFIVEVFLIRPFVRFVRVRSFTNEEQIRLKFGLF